MAAIQSSSQTEGGWRGWLNKLASNEALLGYLFILPSFIGFMAFIGVPAIRSVFISFTQWNLLSDAKYVGFDNYNTIFADDRFWKSLQITATYVIWNIPIQTVLAIFIAVLLERVSNSTILRSIMILPWLMPNVIVALLFVWLLDPSLGLINIFLKNIGIGQQGFFGDPKQAIASVAGVNIWRHMGYNAILIFAGLKTIPRSLYEAATVDGATAWRQFLSITLPLLRPVLVFVLVTTVIGSFQIFDTIAVATEGGPVGATRTIIYYIYEQVFERR
ncbi:MAG TPA: sugar ABC transporter permease, partial [Phototrophicaceae bacterium]|nr:sugar ABC transporter permease [Phototrophicaceae bacterium]